MMKLYFFFFVLLSFYIVAISQNLTGKWAIMWQNMIRITEHPFPSLDVQNLPNICPISSDKCFAHITVPTVNLTLPA